jgi:hypothetical protein
VTDIYDLAGHLRNVAAMLERGGIMAVPGGRYRCNEALVLAEGCLFPLDVAETPRMTAKQCFVNAAMLALEDDDLVYIEGYAASVIPTEHAWCWSLSGKRIVDPTWERGLAYMGIPFTTDFLRRRLLETGKYGLLDDGLGGFPMLAAGLSAADYRDERAMP